MASIQFNSRAVLTIAAAMLAGAGKTHAEPPFGGTIFINPDLITPEDPTTFLSVTAAGRGIKTMFDRRVNNWVNVNAYLFNASFKFKKSSSRNPSSRNQRNS